MTCLLAIDCQEAGASVAIWHEGELSEQEQSGAREQARSIFALVDNCLKTAGLNRSDIDAVTWSAGPGSFTGVRIATATAQGIAYALDIPLIPVSSLHALALAATEQNPLQEGVLLTVLDARMDELYWASFALQTGLLPERLSPDRLSRADQIELSTMRICTGTGTGLLGVITDGCIELPVRSKARHLIPLALPSLAAQATHLTALQAEPVYLRTESAWKQMETK